MKSIHSGFFVVISCDWPRLITWHRLAVIGPACACDHCDHSLLDTLVYNGWHARKSSIVYNCHSCNH
ncbi:unnamed protein product [Staurois parvus]|uniref:Uncharacterized protein n=1 Tax=Staurois parvus TaxID=386267 RepID=A0ABN9FFE3_9NEOB|nr:unnamed protein product [Staurois parvus]